MLCRSAKISLIDLFYPTFIPRGILISSHILANDITRFGVMRRKLKFGCDWPVRNTKSNPLSVPKQILSRLNPKLTIENYNNNIQK